MAVASLKFTIMTAKVQIIRKLEWSSNNGNEVRMVSQFTSAPHSISGQRDSGPWQDWHRHLMMLVHVGKRWRGIGSKVEGVCTR